MPISTDAQAVLDEFAGTPAVGAAQVAQLKAAIEASPALVQQFNSAVASGHLAHFALLPAGANAGGTYDGPARTMNLPATLLASATAGSPAANELTFILGHELQHGFNHASTAAAYAAFAQQVKAIAQTHAPVHDYTPAVQTLIAANRRDEAGAQIAGWNALVDRVRAANPNASLADVFSANPARMADFIERDTTVAPPVYRLRPGLTVDGDLRMAATAANVEAMGGYYFDKPGNVSGLGHHGNSSYHDYYGAYAVGVVLAAERGFAQPFQGQPPRLTLDMAQLGLSEAVMEQNGIHLGHDTSPAPYYDSSTQPPALRHFHHTATSHTHVPIHSLPADERSAAAIDPRSPAHPGHRLYVDVAAAVDRLDAAHGRTPDETSERVKASVYALATANGLQRVSDVVPGGAVPGVAAGERLFVVEGGLSDPRNRVAYMATADAVRMPVAESFRHAESLGMPQATAQAQEVGQREAVRTAAAPPVLSR